MDQFALQEVQKEIFVYSAMQSSKNLPGNITLDATQSENTFLDLQELQEKGLLTWDFKMKISSWGTIATNPNHAINCVAYYGNAENGYYCLGYAIGCITEDNTTVEVALIEKRNDASTDLEGQFLPIIFDAFSTYALYLNSEGETKISTFALVGPLPGVKKYYQENGFSYVEDYYKGSDAMLKKLINE